MTDDDDDNLAALAFGVIALLALLFVVVLARLA